MPITRTPIIDDSGWGTDGTVLDNAWKQEFYNQIDAFVGVGGAAAVVTVPFAAGNFTVAGGSGTWTVSAATVNYQRINPNLTLITFYIPGPSSVVGGTPTVLAMRIPGLPSSSVITGGPFHYFGPVTGTGYFQMSGDTVQMLRDLGGTAWVAGNQYLVAQCLSWNA